MRFAAFVAPFLLDATVRFIDNAARLPGVRLALITSEPAERLPPRLRESIAAHWRVDDALDPQQIVDAVRGLSAHHGGRRIERMIAVLEQLQVPVAEAREFLGIPGMNAATATKTTGKSSKPAKARRKCSRLRRMVIQLSPAWKPSRLIFSNRRTSSVTGRPHSRSW